MRAVVFRRTGEWGCEEVPVPRLEAPDQVLLRVDRIGICDTDLRILSDPPGQPAMPGSILGHEYVASVEETGPAVRDVEPGDRVVVDPHVTCGRCDYCRLGLANACEHMTTLGIFCDGGLAEFSLVPARALHRIGRDVPLDHAVLAEPLASVLHAFGLSALVPGERVAILDAGPIGLLLLLVFRWAGAGRVVVVDATEGRRRVATELGADATADSARGNRTDGVRSVLAAGADLVVDASGMLLPEALALARPGGRALLLGMNQHAERPVSKYLVTNDEVVMIGSFIQRTAFPKVVRVLEAGFLPLGRLVTHRVPLDAVGQGFDALGAGEAIKVVVEP
jgi:threonine dehydrogenase-like Zn-dependent dehydrogenase